jgi:Pectate lyase superfamily protein
VTLNCAWPNGKLLSTIFGLVCLTLTAQAASTIISQGARDVKNASAYGGVSAKGDGKTDDTQAFLDALNKSRYRGPETTFTPVAIYVPPGTYLVRSSLIIWANTFLFGEPSSPPTVVLAASSPSFHSGANPFVVTASGYNTQPYSTNWSNRDGVTYASTNNIFSIDVHDINFIVESGNPGCSDVYLFAMAQQGSLRNSVLTADAKTAHCLRTGLSGGGGIIQGVTCNGGHVALERDATSMLVYRGCTFNGPVRLAAGQQFNFIACTFDDRVGKGFVRTGADWFAMEDCTFGAGTPFDPGGYSGWAWHLENIQWPNRSSVPAPLLPYADATGNVAQFTSNNIYYNGMKEPGASANTRLSAKGSPYPNPVYPRPTSVCVNVKSYGATGNGATDDTAAIRAAYSASKEVFFPLGTYRVRQTIKLGPGMKMFGQGGGSCIRESASVPALSVTGRSVDGVVVNGIWISACTSVAPCLVWNGDQSSIVMDARFSSEGTGGTLVAFQTGGGFFENGWWPNTASTGLKIRSTDPLYLYSIQAEHSASIAVEFNGARNVFALNLECENSQLACSITNSRQIFVQGLVCGNWTAVARYAIDNATSNVSIFGVLINHTTSGVLRERGVVYGSMAPSGHYSILDGYVRSDH